MTNAAPDLEGVLKRIGGDRELLREILHIFLDIAPEMMTNLATAVAGHDLPRILTLAHEIKGCAANVGALELVRQVNLLEMSARQGLINHVRECHEPLRHELQQVCMALDTYLHPPNATPNAPEVTV